MGVAVVSLRYFASIRGALNLVLSRPVVGSSGSGSSGGVLTCGSAENLAAAAENPERSIPALEAGMDRSGFLPVSTNGKVDYWT